MQQDHEADDLPGRGERTSVASNARCNGVTAGRQHESWVASEMRKGKNERVWILLRMRWESDGWESKGRRGRSARYRLTDERRAGGFAREDGRTGACRAEEVRGEAGVGESRPEIAGEL